jgi:YVTN family beta-propeller protein
MQCVLVGDFVRVGAMLLMSGLAGALSLIAVSPQANASPGWNAAPARAVNAETAPAGTLPITNFHEFVADTAHGHLFFTQGYGSVDNWTKHNSIIVTNLSGQLVATIGGQDNVQDIALSPDGSTLYAADEGADEVSAISTTTLKVTAQYPLGAGNAPYGVAVQSGKIWVGYQGPTGGLIGEIDPAPPATFTPQAVTSFFSVGPDLEGDPAGGGTLVASDSYDTIDWATMSSYNVAAATPAVYQPPSIPGSCSGMVSYAVFPGGADFIAACQGTGNAAQPPPTTALVYNSQTFAQAGSYKTGAVPVAVAVAPGGAKAGTVAAGAGTAPGIAVYPPGAKTPVNEYTVPGSQIWLVNNGLAFSADGSALYAVYQDGTGAPGSTVRFLLRVHHDPTVTASAITLNGPAKAIRGHSLTITGKLALTVGEPPAGSRITITRSLAGTSTARWTRTISANGSFSLTDTPPALGSYSYTATYAGTASIQATSASRVVLVTKIPSSLRLTASGETVDYRAAVTVTAHLGATYNGRTVRIYAKAFGTKTTALIKVGRVDSRGDLTVTYRPVHSTTFSAAFAGDAKYQPAAASRVVYARAGVTQQLSGYYGSEYIGSTRYWVYHDSGTLTSAVTVAPNKKGGCVAAEVQQYYQGAWQDNTSSSCQLLGASSRAVIRFSLSGAEGGQFRVRGDFSRASGDTTNGDADSSWAYFTVTS